MKKNNIFKIASSIFGVLIVIVAIAVFHSVVAGLSGAAMTMAEVGAVVAGETITTGEVKTGSPDLDKNYVSQKITEMRPSATPLDTIIRQISNQKNIDSQVSEYYAVDTRPLKDTVKTAYTKDGDGDITIDLAVNNIQSWAEDDTLMIPTINGSDSKPLVCFVLTKTITGGLLTLQPMNGSAGSGTTAGELIFPATIPVSTLLVRMGSCKHELDAQTSPYGIVPVKEFNYAQIFMAQVEESTFQKIHGKEVNWSFSDYEAQNIYDMRATMEFSFLFGYRNKFYDKKNAKERYMTGGITRFITKGLEYGTGGTDRTITDATFVDWTKSIFTGNSGAEKRVFFGGNGLTANLSKISTVQKQIEAKKTEVKWGITFNQIETNFGILLYKHHNLLDTAGWGDAGIVLDMNHIEKHTFVPLSAKKLDLITSGQRNANATVIAETTGVITRYPDTHAIIKPKA